MAWTPTLKAAEKQNGKIHVVIRYTDGVSDFNEDFYLVNPQTLNDVVANRITQLTALDTFLATLVVGSGISTTPTPPVVLLQPEIDRNAWLVNYRKLVKAKQTLVDTGIITTANPTYSALLSTVQGGLIASYLDYI